MPAVINGPSFSDADLVRIGNENPGWHFERADDGALIVSPTSTPGGARGAEALVQLSRYAKRAGGKVYDSSTGFKTPAGGVVCPDAAWIRAERAADFSGDDGFWAIMPDIVIEVVSKTDSWPSVTAKIDKYAGDGAAYAIAIDPDTRKTSARGEAPAGFELDVDAIVDA